MEKYILLGLLVSIALFTIVLYLKVIKNESKKEAQLILKPKEISVESNILVDAPTTQDRIGFNDYANILAESINECNNFIVYGIYGRWGTGKTSLMYMIKDLVKSDNKVIWFDSWRFKGKISIFDALCSEIYDDLKFDLNNSYLRSIFSNAIKQIRSKNKGIGYDIKKLSRSNKDISAVVGYLNKYKNKKIIIFIDDLDRCEPSEAVEFLENLKVFFGVSNMVFVIGVNYDIICNEISKKFRDISGNKSDYNEEYISKIINIPFFIPDLDKYTIKNFISKNIPFKEIVEISEVLASGLENNIRSVKRVVNSYLILYRIAQKRLGTFDGKMLAKMLIIKFRFREIYSRIILDENYLYILQDIALDNYVYRRNSSFQNKYTSKNDFQDGHSTKEYTLPNDLREILKIEPYFRKGELNKYISLLKEDNYEDKDNIYKLQANALNEFKKGNLINIEDLKVFSKNIRNEIINSLLSSFNNYDLSNQREAIRILRTSLNKDAAQVIYKMLRDEAIKDVTLKGDIINMLLSSNVDISEYVIQLQERIEYMDLNEKRLYLDVCIQIIINGGKYCIDILSNLIDIFDFVDTDYKIRENIAEALGKSQDKKSLDILTRLLKDESITVAIKSINSIGMLDPEYLVNLFSDLFNIKELRVPYINAIINYANNVKVLTQKISIEELKYMLETEENEDILVSLIKLTSTLIKIINDNFYVINKNQFSSVKNIIHLLTRQGENWRVRDEAEKAYSVILNAEPRITGELSF